MWRIAGYVSLILSLALVGGFFAIWAFGIYPNATWLIAGFVFFLLAILSFARAATP